MRSLCTALCLAVFASAANAQNIVSNFSFENPAVVAPGYVSYSSVFTGWTVTTGNIELVGVNGNSNAYINWSSATAANGTQVLDLSGNQRGTIQQTLTPGNSAINLAFNYSRNIDFVGAGTFTGQVRVFDGANVYFAQTFTRNAATDGATLSNFNWDTFTQNNISIGSSTTVTLEFSDLTTGVIPTTQGIVLDNVNVTPVPEPATMIAVSALGIGLLGWRRKRS